MGNEWNNTHLPYTLGRNPSTKSMSNTSTIQKNFTSKRAVASCTLEVHLGLKVFSRVS
jgi:hypothetical protein